MATPADPVTLIDQLTWQLALTLAIALVLGALGGLVPGRAPVKVDPPPAPGTPDRELSKHQRAIVGAVAAAAVLFVTDIATPLQLVCGSLVAGYAGTAVLSSLEARLIAVLAQRENAAMRTQIAELDADGRQLAAHLDNLASAQGPVAVSAAAATAGTEVAAIRKRNKWL